MKLRTLISLFCFLPFLCIAQSNDDCLDCHNDEELTMERNGKEVSLHLNPDIFGNSVHADMECINCHEDFDIDEIPHKDGDNIAKVSCDNCHDTEDFEMSIHSEKKIECSACHGTHDIRGPDEFKKLFVESCTNCHVKASVKNYKKSIHYSKYLAGEKSPSCVDCHQGSAHKIKKANFSEEELHEACAKCHEGQVKNFEKSLHGEALQHGRFLAPNCITCHNSHEIKKSSDPKAKTYVSNIPYLCGDCHKDGTEVSELKSISQRHILEDYQESIHGDGLLKRGLIVTAVCTSCHFSHNILHHEDKNSSINRNNIATTCMQCHSQIENVHTKVIDGKLWEEEPHKVPACIECHQPHKARKVFYEKTYTDNYCMECHGDKNMTYNKNGKEVSLFVDHAKFENSAHQENSCIKCHTNIVQNQNPVCKDSGPVDCSICHAEHVDDYEESVHGLKLAQGDTEAPYCTDCHGKHDVLKKDNPLSQTSKSHIHLLCGQCHIDGAPVQRGNQHSNTVGNYSMSIHGKGLLESGLTVSATCTDCHTSHLELPRDNPTSSINPNNIAETCANCHSGIFEQFNESIHSPAVSKTTKKLPTCYDCHKSHSISRASTDSFKSQILEQCGECHEDVTDTYFETLHGKVTKLGSTNTAKCHDCHGAHNILPADNNASTLSRAKIVETCASCHPNSNRKFVGYLTHATHHDKDKYPYLYYTFWAMTILLISTFAFFGMHTLLWLPRALKEKKEHAKKKNIEGNGNE